MPVPLLLQFFSPRYCSSSSRYFLSKTFIYTWRLIFPAVRFEVFPPKAEGWCGLQRGVILFKASSGLRRRSLWGRLTWTVWALFLQCSDKNWRLGRSGFVNRRRGREEGRGVALRGGWRCEKNDRQTYKCLGKQLVLELLG